MDRFHRTYNVIYKLIFLMIIHKAIQISSLSVIIIIFSMIIAVCITRNFQGRFSKLLIINRTLKTIGLVVNLTAKISIKTHMAITIIVMDRATRTIDWKLCVIRSNSISMRIRIRHQTTLQHFVW